MGTEEKDVRGWNVDLFCGCEDCFESGRMGNDEFCSGVCELIGEFGDCVAWICWGDYCTGIGCSEGYDWEVNVVGCEEGDDIFGLDVEFDS